MKRKITAISLAVMLVCGMPLAVPPVAASTETAFEPAEELLQTIDSGRIYRHIAELSKEPRVAGTESEQQAVRYIRDAFKSYGYRVDVQPFTFTAYTEPQKVRLQVEGLCDVAAGHFTYGMNGDVSAKLIDAGLGKPRDFKKAKGKIAVIRRGEIPFSEKIANASRAGAAGVILYNNEPGELGGSLGEPGKHRIPAVAMSRDTGEAILEHIKARPDAEARILVEGAETTERESHNVIATKKAGAKKKGAGDREIIIISSHLDSAPGAPGANDNASGTAVVLEMARVLKNIPAEAEIRFVAFGAEELGLLGSEKYISLLPESEKKRIIANFNLDMVGSRDAGDLTLQTVDGKPNLVTELARSSSKKLNGTPTPVIQGNRSDHVPFHEAGIPAALLIHHPAEPWYHTPDDTSDKISKEKLRDVARIVTMAVYGRMSRPK
ncbi:M28 family peptidase [Bhargavaea cecembensis]|uniref:M28 family peptidase n=1 Tax=Bhargavaea cecembensis TaxID=394098 RepID=UPI00058F7B65|nr:M28 family peptidase [Bhargavaea cecembensis]